MKKIDCRGLACPAPVLTAKNAIEGEGLEEVSLLVDNEAAKQNVSRFLESQNFEVTVTGEQRDFLVAGRRRTETCACEVMPEYAKSSREKKIMVMVATDRIGHGDDELGAKLMVNFLRTLNEMGKVLWRLVFVNSGVKLAVEGAEVLPILKDLEREKVPILVCGTCLTHFGLLDKKVVGETTNMLDIVTAMQLADSVINI